MIFKKIGSMENVEVICHYLPLLHKDPSGIRTSSISGNEELIDEQRPSERNHKTRKTTDKWIHP